MKPRIILSQVKLPNGDLMSLYETDGAFSINMCGQELMHSKASASETLLGQIGTEKLNPIEPSTVLIGGLGLGFTLRSVLESVGPKVVVELVELIPEVIQWNKEYLSQLNGDLLNDSRLQIKVEDVNSVIRSAKPNSYDAILLDIDNGPVAMVAASNRTLYSRSGILAMKQALKRSGRAVIWSAGQDMKFENLLKKCGFTVRIVRAKVHERAKRPSYFLYIAEK